MIRLIGLWLVGCAMCVTPVVADEDLYDGPTAIKPLTVTPQPQRSAPPNTVCDFEHQCYPEKGGPMVPAPVAPPAMAAKPVAPGPAGGTSADGWATQHRLRLVAQRQRRRPRLYGEGSRLLTTVCGTPPNYELHDRGLHRALNVDFGRLRRKNTAIAVICTIRGPSR
jgi:hypothetical protein